MVMISDRRAEVEDRAVPGHWEGDLILGVGGRSAVGTMVERTTRMTLLLHLPDGRAGIDVEKAMRKAEKSLPKELSRSITWDQGVEMCRRLDFTIRTGIPIHFCNPHSPGQRSSNENTNGLLRQYMPKGTDPTKHSANELRKVPAKPQWTSARDPRLHDTVTEVHRTRCAHQLKPLCLDVQPALSRATTAIQIMLLGQIDAAVTTVGAPTAYSTTSHRSCSTFTLV